MKIVRIEIRDVLELNVPDDMSGDELEECVLDYLDHIDGSSLQHEYMVTPLEAVQ